MHLQDRAAAPVMVSQYQRERLLPVPSHLPSLIRKVEKLLFAREIKEDVLCNIRMQYTPVITVVKRELSHHIAQLTRQKSTTANAAETLCARKPLLYQYCMRRRRRDARLNVCHHSHPISPVTCQLYQLQSSQLLHRFLMLFL